MQSWDKQAFIVLAGAYVAGSLLFALHILMAILLSEVKFHGKIMEASIYPCVLELLWQSCLMIEILSKHPSCDLFFPSSQEALGTEETLTYLVPTAWGPQGQYVCSTSMDMQAGVIIQCSGRGLAACVIHCQVYGICHEPDTHWSSSLDWETIQSGL